MKIRHAALTAVLLISGCATSEPPPGAPRADLPRHTIGSEWEFRERVSGSWAGGARRVPRFVFQGEREWRGKKLLAYGTFHLDNRMRFVARVREGQVLETWDPHYSPIEFPLFVGRSWSTNFAYQNQQTGRAYASVWLSFKVEAFEKVTVPAGTFDAFRIGGGETGVHWTYWYAPEVTFLTKVRVERNSQSPSGPGLFEWELVRYSLK
jgi:hypothetical protein